MRFACSMTRSIDPRRPWKLTTEQSALVNEIPCIVKLSQHVAKLAGAIPGSRREENHRRALQRLRNEKQRQRGLVLRDLIEQYKQEQPVIDSERQLSGKVVDAEVRVVLERSDVMTPEQLLLIDAILTLPETSLEKECQRRVAAINAVTAYCGVEEGISSRRGRLGRQGGHDTLTVVKVEEPARSWSDKALSQAISSIKTDKRPTICFLCLGNPALPIRERVVSYSTPGSLSRHFLRKHVRKLKEWEQIDCRICDVRLKHRHHLQNHAERFHGTVSQTST